MIRRAKLCVILEKQCWWILCYISNFIDYFTFLLSTFFLCFFFFDPCILWVYNTLDCSKLSALLRLTLRKNVTSKNVVLQKYLCIDSLLRNEILLGSVAVVDSSTFIGEGRKSIEHCRSFVANDLLIALISKTHWSYF